MLKMGSFELRSNPNLEVTEKNGIIQTYGTEHRTQTWVPYHCMHVCRLTTAANVSDRIARGL